VRLALQKFQRRRNISIKTMSKLRPLIITLFVLAAAASSIQFGASLFTPNEPNVAIGMSHTEAIKTLGPAHQIWQAKEEPQVVMWFGTPDLQGKPVPNPGKILVYREGIDHTTYVFVDAQERVTMVNSGGT
jgi:hypothetical protein